VLSLALSTMFNSTTFSSSRRRLQRTNPSGAGEQVEQSVSPPPLRQKSRGRAELGLYLRLNTASNPSSSSWRLVRSIVAMLVSSAAAIPLSLQPSPSSDTSAFSRMRAFLSSREERLPWRINFAANIIHLELRKRQRARKIRSFPGLESLWAASLFTESRLCETMAWYSRCEAVGLHTWKVAARAGRFGIGSPGCL
jgi:hypothetical protein